MPTLVELLEAGVHFGHKKERSHPRALDYTFTLREGVYVIDLEKTVAGLESAIEYLKRQLSSGKTILFVGTKRQAKELTKRVAESLSMPYISHRWLGGTLTNFDTVKKSLIELERLENKTKSPEYEALSKKEKKSISDKIEKLNLTFFGIKEMKVLPDTIFVIDANKEKLSILEANRMEIPVVAICDTDANPVNVKYPIPANDDAPKSLEIVMNFVEKSLLEAGGVKKVENTETVEEEKPVEEVKEPLDSARGGEKPVKKTTKKMASKVKK